MNLQILKDYTVAHGGGEREGERGREREREEKKKKREKRKKERKIVDTLPPGPFHCTNVRP